MAFSRLDSNGDGYISLDEIVSTMPSDGEDEGDDAHLVVLSQVSQSDRGRRALTIL